MTKDALDEVVNAKRANRNASFFFFPPQASEWWGSQWFLGWH